MKEEKLFDIVNSVDDDLICEMLEYSPDTKTKGGEYEGELYFSSSAPEKPKKTHYWQYPAAAAAVVLALVGVLFIFNMSSTLPYEGQPGEQETTTTTTSTSEGEITTTDDPYTPVDTNFPYEFTEEDRELQKFLAETVNEAAMYQSLYDGAYFGGVGYSTEEDGEHERIINARFPQMEEAVDKQIGNQYILLSDKMPFKTAEELEASLKQYYSSEIASRFMGSVGIGEITERTEDYCLIEIKNVVFDENGFMFSYPKFIEINGRLYRDGGEKGGWFFSNWSMAKVVSKTDEELIFSYLGYGMDDIKEIRAGLGRLKYEDGWKYDWWDISAPYEMVDFEEVWGIDTGNPYPLDLLRCRIDEEGKYYVDEENLTLCDDYDLFRQYFFGTWDGTFSFAYEKEEDGIVIDDSIKSFYMTGLQPWCVGEFYRIGDNVLVFGSSTQVGGTLFWLDMNDPKTMYTTWGNLGSWLRVEDGSEEPVVAKLKKSYLAPNEPEKNFMSIFRLREISRDYGIDLSLLTDFGFNYYEDDKRYWLAHDYMMSFYPVFLISESPDKLEFTTTVCAGYDDVVADASFTVERINGEWVRTEHIYNIHHVAITHRTVVPYKVVRVGAVDVMYTDSYPEFAAPAAGEATFTEMSTLELMEYYGMEYMIELINEGSFIEVGGGNAPHGIYTYPDGFIYDINVFTFKTSYDDLNVGKKFTLALGRETTFGREYSDEGNDWGITPKYYSEDRDTFFVIHELFGSCIMVSGKVDELTDYDDRELKETYHNNNYPDVNNVWQGVPCELNLFLQDAVLATSYFAGEN